MKRYNFFAKVASKALALAATVMMSAAFTACSKDSGGGDDPTPLPEPKGTLTVNGVDTPIRMAEYLKESDGNYYLYLYFANDRKGRVKFELNKDLHMKGNSINLSEIEEWHRDGFYWKIDYTDSNNKDLIHASGSYHYPKLFEAGTLTATGDFIGAGTLDIKLENGSIVGTDGKTYAIALNYNGPVTNKNVPLPAPKAGTVTIDGKEKTIHTAQYKHVGYDDYWIQLFLSDDHKERVELWLDTKAHIGHDTDLTKQEEALTMGHWQITYHDSKGNRLICACGTHEGPILFETGTLTVAGDIDGTLNIKLENGRIVGENGKEYTLTLSYNDAMTKME